MINVICAVHRPLPHMVRVPTHLVICRPHASMDNRYNSLPFQFRIPILTHSRVKLSCYRVLTRATTRDVVGRVSCSRAASDMAATTASRWILAAPTFRWILATIASSRPPRPEFQHSSPNFRSRILATTVVATNGGRLGSWFSQ
jgi:hypothetical protein